MVSRMTHPAALSPGVVAAIQVMSAMANAAKQGKAIAYELFAAAISKIESSWPTGPL